MGLKYGRGDQVADACEVHVPYVDTPLEAREAVLEAREAAVEAREAALAERMDASHAILAAAKERDAVSDARDNAADNRESALDLAQMLDPTSDYGAQWPEWRHARLDRAHARDDRTASRHDREALTAGGGEVPVDGRPRTAR